MLMGSFNMFFLLGVLQLCMVSLAIFSSNFTDLSALLVFKSEMKIEPDNALGVTEVLKLSWGL